MSAIPANTIGSTGFTPYSRAPSSRVEMPASGKIAYPIRVRAASDTRVTLPRTIDLARPMPLGFTWPGGHAQLGAILDTDRGWVTREVVRVTQGRLRPGVRGLPTTAFAG